MAYYELYDITQKDAKYLIKLLKNEIKKIKENPKDDSNKLIRFHERLIKKLESTL